MEQREPRKIKELHQQIYTHPNYKNLEDSMKFAFEACCMAGFSVCYKENNKWARQLWRHLYLGGPLPE